MSVISTGAARTLPVPWLRLAALLVGAALLWVALDLIMDAGAQVSGAHVQRFDQAVLLAPGGVDSGLAPIRLPGNCHAHGECLQRYRLTVRHDPMVSGQYALYIPQFTGRLEVTLDGVSIIDSNLDETSLRFGQGAPKLVALPARLLQEGSNEFGLALGDRLGAGAVGPIYFGPEVTLRPSYETAYFLVVTLPRLMDGALLAIGAIMLMIWLRRRQDQLYLLCGVISISFALSSLSPSIAGAFGAGWLLPVSVLRFLGASLLLPFIWRLVGRIPPVATRWFLVPPVMLILTFWWLPDAWATMLVPMLFVPVIMVLAVVALHGLWRAGTRGRDLSALTLLVVIGLLLSLTARDQLLMTGMMDESYVLWSRFNGPILALIMGAILLRRFAAGQSLLENFNARLHEDVAAARGKLQQAFEREQRHSRKVTLATERIRLMSDLHDGIAGHLVSIIALSERGQGPEANEVAQACRRALADLRLVVDSMDDVGDDLGMMLAAFRERIEPQVRRSGLRLDWQVRDLPDLPGLSPATTLGIFRILQEAVNNAVRHSGSSVVEVASSESPLPDHRVRLVVRDQGRGGAEMRQGHHGMRNIQRRAAAFGASVDVQSTAAGTSVVLDLPSRIRD